MKGCKNENVPGRKLASVPQTQRAAPRSPIRNAALFKEGVAPQSTTGGEPVNENGRRPALPTTETPPFVRGWVSVRAGGPSSVRERTVNEKRRPGHGEPDRRSLPYASQA